MNGKVSLVDSALHIGYPARVKKLGRKRLIAPVLLAAGIVWSVAGCGGDVIVPLTSGAATGLVLLDSVTGKHFSLSVANGAAGLTEIGNSGVAAQPELIDTVTGSLYGLEVIGGALTLVPGSSPGVLRIELADAVTAKTYALSVVSGALSLIPG